MKKVLSKIISTTKNTTTESTNDGSSNTYQQRKSMESSYQDLFQVLFRFPDKKVIHRVINAINGLDVPASTQSAIAAHINIKCPKCSRKRQRLTDVATQTLESTEDVDKETTHGSTSTAKHNNQITHNSKRSFTTSCTNNDDTSSLTPENELGEAHSTAPKRKRRKRKICLPQVVKRSQAQEAQEKLQPKLKNPKLDESYIVDEPQMRERSDSLGSVGSLWSLESSSILDPNMSREDIVKRVFTDEYNKSDLMEAGLLPIHHAIITNELNYLRRQIYVWKVMKKGDLNELLTDNDTDCLQLAILNNCYPTIVKVLLESGLNANCVDAHSNTIIHLALINEAEMDSFDRLMRHIDLSLLLKLNDDGYTALHVAVRYNCFLLAERMLNVMDERLLGSALYEREPNSNEADFIKFYENVCKNLETRFAVAKVKRKLLEAGEMRSGNTALFFAIENKMDHFIYFLLAHLTDPRVQNHGGQDAKSYFAEFGKILSLSLKIDKTMDLVINLIK